MFVAVCFMKLINCVAWGNVAQLRTLLLCFSLIQMERIQQIAWNMFLLNVHWAANMLHAIYLWKHVSCNMFHRCAPHLRRIIYKKFSLKLHGNEKFFKLFPLNLNLLGKMEHLLLERVPYIAAMPAIFKFNNWEKFCSQFKENPTSREKPSNSANFHRYFLKNQYNFHFLKVKVWVHHPPPRLRPI